MKRSNSWSAMSMGADGIMDAMDGSDGANGERTREAAEVSPSIAFNALALFTSYFLKFVLPDSPHVFATVTNVSFLLSAFYVQFRVTSVYDTDRESIKDSYLVANICTCSCIFLTLLGSSSLAFHSESVLFQPSHTLDILFGWLLLLSLAFVSISVSFYAWAGRRLTRQLHASAFVGFLVALAAVIIGYDGIYTHQLEFMITTACVAIASSVASRLILVGKRPTLQSIGYAIAEIICLILVAISAVFCQGELLGTRISRESDSNAYDHYHGIWHVLLSTVSTIVYARSLSVARMVENDYPVCVCMPSLYDIAGEVAVLLYAITALVLKELNVANSISLITMAIVSAPLYIHAFATSFL